LTIADYFYIVKHNNMQEYKWDAGDYKMHSGSQQLWAQELLTKLNLNKDDVVLDIGCGAGVDTILASMMTGPTGNVVGVDIVPEMLQQAEKNLMMTDQKNVSFKKTSGEKLPYPVDTFDVVISNGVINLIPDKEAALAEIIRVLKPGGRLMVADQIDSGNVQKDIRARLANWFQ